MNSFQPDFDKETFMTHRMTSHAPQALGTLQDAGELAVMTPNEGPVRHRYAMVVAFESEDELRRALEGRGPHGSRG